MSQSRDSDDFGSELRDLSEAELEERANKSVQEFQERFGQVETDRDTTQDGLTDDSGDSSQSQGDTLRETTADSQQCATDKPEDSVVQCQNSTGADSELQCPWRGEQYEADKTKFMRTVVLNSKSGNPTRLSEGVKSVYGEDYTNTEYQRLRRLVIRCPWFRKVDKGGKFVQVEPEPICFKADRLLRQQYEYPLKARRDGDGQSTAGESETAASGRLSKTPKERVQSYLESHKAIGAKSVKRDLLREFVTWRTNIAGTYTIMQQYRDRPKTDKEFLLVQCPSRFKDKPEATKSNKKLTTALDKAREIEDRGVMVTLTPDPKRFESHTEILEAVQDSVGNFIDCFAYRLGDRPEYIKSLEFQQNGLPHYHVVLFGVRNVEDGKSETQKPTISEQEVRKYWDETRDVGKEVWVQPVFRRNDSWLLYDDKDGKRTLSYYLLEAMRGLCELADMDESELWDMVEAEDTSLWRQVLYWATEKQYVSCSNGLKESTNSNTTNDIKQWDYIGTARANQISPHVTANAITWTGNSPE